MSVLHLSPSGVAIACDGRGIVRPSSAGWPTEFARRPGQAARNLLAAVLAATARAGGEPAWHRRQRRTRAQARTLVRLAAAKSILDHHHSRQRAPAAHSHHVGPTGVQNMAKDEAEFAAGASRHPYWSCGCGTSDNWGDRRRCRTCKREAPFSIRKRQSEQGGGGNKGTKSGTGGGGGGGKGRPVNGGGGRRRCGARGKRLQCVACRTYEDGQ